MIYNFFSEIDSALTEKITQQLEDREINKFRYKRNKSKFKKLKNRKIPMTVEEMLKV